MKKTIIKELQLEKGKLQYFLTYKKVKNINLRINQDGTIRVSASRFIKIKKIEEFILSKADFILNAQERFKNQQNAPKTEYFSEKEIRKVVTQLCEKAFVYFKLRGIKYPEIRFRKMVSQWGNCRSREGILTFNTNLMYTPIECVEYVVLHEFTHFLQANHSKLFYEELEKVCPHWKECRKKLKEINLR